jgi:hypothetical protein
LRVLPDGSWRVGEQPVSHARSLRYFKQRLVFDETGAFVVDGAKRMPIRVEGPPFQVESIVFDTDKAEMRIHLDDGSEEVLTDPVVAMSPETGRFECVVKAGQARAVLSPPAQDTLLDRLEEENGDFVVPFAGRRCRVVP